MNKLKKLFWIIKDPLFLKALMGNKVAAGVEHLALHSCIEKNALSTIIDVGANRGQFALAARRCFPSARIISFEPLIEAAGRYKRVFAHDRRTSIYEVAIAAREGDTLIHISHADDSSSLLPITKRQNELFPGTAEKETRQVKITPLDAVLSAQDIGSPALLKIDVQGFERQVLEGCTSLLNSFSYVYVECSFVELYEGQPLAHEVIAFMAEHCFVLCGVYNVDYDKNGAAIQGDFLFNNKVMMA